ncbi:iron ABC transporter permease [Agrobacterium cavarae]|uniref:FecCD family ABC transporter permease n=1 Tax=Agrobacterium cavarae TaxID=2528239 RepID=UPI002FD9C73E
MRAAPLTAPTVSRWALLVPLAGLTMVLALLHLSIGARGMPPSVVLDTLFSFDPANFNHRILFSLRLPRLCAALLSGAALGTAGLLLQSLLRNPLAEPHILGLNAGASLAVVVATALPAAIQPTTVERPLLAACGGAVVFAAVLSLSSAGRLGMTVTKLVFCGIALSALASALVSAILLLDQETLEAVRFWLVGDLAGASWQQVIAALLPLAVAGAVALVIAPRLDAMALGDASAISLGVPLKTTRLVGLAAAALASGTAVSTVGPIGFVGLIVPGVAIRLTGGRHLDAVMLSALGGAALLVMADIVARSILPGREVATGIMTALVGAPVFLLIVARRL